MKVKPKILTMWTNRIPWVIWFHSDRILSVAIKSSKMPWATKLTATSRWCRTIQISSSSTKNLSNNLATSLSSVVFSLWLPSCPSSQIKSKSSLKSITYNTCGDLELRLLSALVIGLVIWRTCVLAASLLIVIPRISPAALIKKCLFPSEIPMPVPVPIPLTQLEAFKTSTYKVCKTST